MNGRGKWICTLLSLGGSVSYCKHNTPEQPKFLKKPAEHTYHTRENYRDLSPVAPPADVRADRQETLDGICNQGDHPPHAYQRVVRGHFAAWCKIEDHETFDCLDVDAVREYRAP